VSLPGSSARAGEGSIRFSHRSSRRCSPRRRSSSCAAAKRLLARGTQGGLHDRVPGGRRAALAHTRAAHDEGEGPFVKFGRGRAGLIPPGIRWQDRLEIRFRSL
jgi:hypothetical protein